MDDFDHVCLNCGKLRGRDCFRKNVIVEGFCKDFVL